MGLQSNRTPFVWRWLVWFGPSGWREIPRHVLKPGWLRLIRKHLGSENQLWFKPWIHPSSVVYPVCFFCYKWEKNITNICCLRTIKDRLWVTQYPVWNGKLGVYSPPIHPIFRRTQLKLLLGAELAKPFLSVSATRPVPPAMWTWATHCLVVLSFQYVLGILHRNRLIQHQEN